MHAAFNHLGKRVREAQEALNQVIREIQKQAERETKTLEQAAFGDEFDEELAPIQDKVVAALQEAMELLDEADRAMDDARRTLEDITSL